MKHLCRYRTIAIIAVLEMRTRSIMRIRAGTPARTWRHYVLAHRLCIGGISNPSLHNRLLQMRRGREEKRRPRGQFEEVESTVTPVLLPKLSRRCGAWTCWRSSSVLSSECHSADNKVTTTIDLTVAQKFPSRRDMLMCQVGDLLLCQRFK